MKYASLVLLLALGLGNAPPVRAAAPADSLDLPETNYYEIDTSYGRMVLRLFDETPVHRDNFKKLVAEGFYDGTTFHRVIEGFMIQGGDPNTRDDDPSDDGDGGPGYTLEAEIVPGFYHRRGAVAAARKGDARNPERRSSGSQFYIVQGRPFDAYTLQMMERDVRRALQDTTFRFSEEARRVYGTEGGAPPLDGQYTIFATVVEGFDVLDRLSAVRTPRRLRQRAHPDVADRPLEFVRMTVRPLPGYAEP